MNGKLYIRRGEETMKYQVEVIKPCTIKARLTLSTPIHGDGDRVNGLKRNLDNMDWQGYQDWKQVIIIDHSPREVVDAVVAMVAASKHPDRREVLWMHGDKATGAWGRFSHNEVLRRCETEYFAFHCDDNFVSQNNYADLIKLMEGVDYGFSYSCCCAFREGDKNLLSEFKEGAFDLGCPVFKRKVFTQHLPDLSMLPDIYNWDWKMVSWLAFCEVHFTATNRIGYFWARDYTGPAEPIVSQYGDKPIGDKRNIWNSITQAPKVTSPDPTTNAPVRTIGINPSGMSEFYRGGWAIEKMIQAEDAKRSALMEADVICIVRTHAPFEIKAGQRVIYSMDDLFWDVPKAHPDCAAMTHEVTNCDYWVKHAHRVVATAQYLAEYMNHRGHRTDAITIDNAVPEDWFVNPMHLPREARDWNGQVVMNLGVKAHEYDLMETGLYAELKNLPGLHIFGYTNLAIPAGIPIIGYPSFQQANQCLLQFKGAIGLVPLIDHPFNQAKSKLKLIEYVAKGIMPLCSPVGEYAILGQKFPWILKPAGMTWLEGVNRQKDNFRYFPELFEYIRSEYSFGTHYPRWRKVFTNW